MKVYNKIGFHTGPGGNPTGIGDYFRTLDAAGIPFMIKAVDSYGPIFEASQLARKSGVPHTLVYRLTTGGQGTSYDFDVPPYKDPKYAHDPEGGAERHWQKTLERIPPEFDKELTWLEPINEVDKNLCDWLGRFAVHTANLAQRDGYKVTLFAWSSGEPEPAGWEEPGMLAYLRLCGQRPSQAAVALHEYAYVVDNIMDGFPFKIGRFKALFDVCDKHGIPRPTIHITEWGWTLDNVPPPEKAIKDIQKVGELYGRYPEIKGAAIWYLGPGFGGIANKAQRLIAPVTDFTRQHPFELELEKAITKPVPPAVPKPPVAPPPVPKTTPKPPPNVTVTDPPPVARPSETTWTGRVTAPAGLNLRTEPSSAQGNATVILKLAFESLVTVLGEANGWCQVRAEGREGFVSAQFLERVAAQPIPKPTPKPTPPPATRPLQTGMNINPDAPHSNPLATGELRGLDWVRWVFKLAARHNPAERQDINAAFNQFDPLVQGYLEQGVGSLIVLNQETVWGNAPWSGNNDWDTYANQLAATARQIASRYKKYGAKVAYEIWNEGDLEHNPASVFVPPAQFAIVLKRVAEAIRAESPQSPLIFGGLATGPNKGIPYLKACKQAINGPWPVDAIGVHPYGRWGTKAPFDWAKLFGTLGQAFAEYERDLPDIPFWITEIGVANDTEIGPQHYNDIAMYVQDVYTTIATQLSHIAPVVIWFAWSDLMRNAGIVDNQGRRKTAVYAAFENIRNRKF